MVETKKDDDSPKLSAKEIAELEAQQMKMDYNGTFGTEHGRRVLEDLMAACHVLEPTNNYELSTLAAQAGRRDVAFHILAQLGKTSFIDIVEEIQNG